MEKIEKLEENLLNNLKYLNDTVQNPAPGIQNIRFHKIESSLKRDQAKLLKILDENFAVMKKEIIGEIGNLREKLDKVLKTSDNTDDEWVDSIPVKIEDILEREKACPPLSYVISH